MKRLPFFIMGALFSLCSCRQQTNPDQLINAKASLPRSFGLSALHQKVVTSFINKRDNTIGILYGNGQINQEYGTHEELFTLVIWHRQEDPHWFGARIPGGLISVETFKTGKNGNDMADYQKFLGKNLVRSSDTTGRSGRIRFILSQKESILP